MQAFKEFQQGCTIFDVVLELYLSLNMLPKLISDNSITDLNALTTTGQKFTYDTDFIYNEKMSDEITKKNYKFRTGDFTLNQYKLGLNNNLVAYYNFNGNSNALVGGINGTNVNAPTFTTGKIGSAIDFGTDTVQRYCQLADNDIFSFTNGLGTDTPFSISMWIKISAFSSQNNYLLSKRVNNSLEEEYMMGVSPTGGIFFQKFSDNDSYKIAGVSGGALLLNNWYHIVYVDDGTIPIGGQLFYINGVAKTTSSTIVNAYAGMPNGTSPLRIGQTTVNPSEARRHRGLIDELGFWKNRILNQSDITNLYNSGAGITYPFK